MITIQLKNGEYIDTALRRFKRLIEKTGLIKELKQRKRYEKPSKEKQKKITAAIKRRLKKQNIQNI